MKLSLVTLAASAAVAAADPRSAAARWNNLRRRLSYEKIAGYAPDSQVTDHCAIDRDQQAIEAQLALKTPESFENAQRIYKEGGNSKSYAQITLTGDGIASDLKKDDPVMGRNAEGNEVSGKAYEDHNAGSKVLKIAYSTTDIQSSYVGCQVGGLQDSDSNQKGCFKDSGDLTIGGQEYPYTYVPGQDNNNGRTIQGFSTGARDKMRVGCKGCPYDDFSYFYDYYGADDYADQWILAAFNGESTQFRNGNADFSRYGLDGKEQVIKKGTAYLSIFMYVIREFEDALDDCEQRCINCNYGSVHAWDEGVCFYTGSIEGQDGITEDGKLLHQLADKRCQDYMTCGVDGTDLAGQAKLNYDLFDLFALGNYQLTSGNCPAARQTTKKIVEKMYVPMIQGAMRYAYKVDKLQGGEKEKAEGAVFAAAVLPKVHAVSPKAANVIYENLRVGATDTNYQQVKDAFEGVYGQMGIKCGDIGGLWNEAEKAYYPGMSPCVEVTSQESSSGGTNKTLAIALGCTFGALFAVAVGVILYMRGKEKQGAPVFKTSEHAEKS